jgi:hypothetical protein
MRKKMRVLALLVVVVGVALQFVPVKDLGSNPPARFTLDAPPEVATILRRSCMDCHSNETRWPLYSRIAPGSWLLADDVHKGRNHLNFSEWGSVDEDERQTDLESCWDQIDDGKMPPKKYIYPFHMSAKLSDGDKALLKAYFLRNKKDDKKDDDAKPQAAEKKAAKAD